MASVSRQLHGRGEAVGPQADDHRVVDPVASSSAHDLILHSNALEQSRTPPAPSNGSKPSRDLHLTRS